MGWVALGLLAVGCHGGAPAMVAFDGAAAADREVVVSGRRWRYGLHLAALPNLIYQLDCLSGGALCSQAIYRALWTGLGLDANDEDALASWKRLRSRHGGQIRDLDRPWATLPLLAPAGGFDLAERQRIAGLVSATPAAFETAVGLLTTEPDARALRALLRRFEARFDRWWRADGLPAGSASLTGFQRLLADPFWDAFMEKAARFYEADLPPGKVFDLHLMVQPPAAAARPWQVAYQLEGHAVVEVPQGARPEATIDVLAHELFHHFFARMRPERRALLLERVCRSERDFSVAAFGVFDDAVAAVLGNGLMGQHYTPPDAFARRLARDTGLTAYRAASVVARALLPSMANILDAGITVSSGAFLDAFQTAASRTYDAGHPRPLDHLHSHLSVADPRFAAAARHLRDAAFAFHPYLREHPALHAEARADLAAHPFMSAALFLPIEISALAQAIAALAPGPGGAAPMPRGPPAAPPASARSGRLTAPLPQDPAAVPPVRPDPVARQKARAAVTALAGRARGFVYALARTPKSYGFIFAAQDAAAMEETVRRFIALPSPTHTGVLVELPPPP